MSRENVNIVKVDRFGLEALTVFLESKRTLYTWWMCLGILAGALGAITFSRELNTRWWILPIYLAFVLGIKRGLMHVSRRVFPGDSWWVATNVFLPTFLLAALGPAVSTLTSWKIVAIPLVVVIGFMIALMHTAFRPVFVRGQFAWIYSGAALGAVTAVAGLVLLRTFDPLTLVTAAVTGAGIGLIYILLTTLLLEYMWDAASSLAQRGMLTVDKHGEFIQGLSYLDHALTLEPNNARLYATRAEVYFKQGDLERARTDVEHALSLDARNPEAHVVRAKLAVEAGDLDSAIATYDEIIADKANFYPAYLNRARTHSLKGNFDRAWDDCDRAALLAEDDALVQVTYADINYRMGNYAAAMEACDRTMTINTVTPVAWAMAFVIRGKCQIIKGNYELAAADFNTVLTGSRDWAVIREAEEAMRALPTPTDENGAAQHEAV
jgi:Tfp pilus assembly protein PilF